MTKRIIVLIVGLFLVTVAAAANWQLVTFNKTAVFFVDIGSIATVEGYRKAWSRIEYNTPHSIGNKPYSSTKSLWYMDCKGKRLTIVSSTYYNKDGEVQESFTNKFFPSQLEDAVPETTGESMLNYVCTENPPSTKSNAS